MHITNRVLLVSVLARKNTGPPLRTRPSTSSRGATVVTTLARRSTCAALYWARARRSALRFWLAL